MKAYLAGPMSGKPSFNFPRFFEVAERLISAGHDIINPAELDDGDTSKPWEYYLRRDLSLLLTCDAVVLLEGWENSRGAKLEVRVAHALKMQFFNEDMTPYDNRTNR